MSLNILVIDDSTTIQKVIRIAFSHYDVNVICVNSLREGVNQIAKIKPNILISDASLAGTNTPEDFKKLSIQSKSPLLLLIGSYENIDEDLFRKEGFSYFLKKPFGSKDIIDKVAEILKHPVPEKEVTNINASPSAEFRIPIATETQNIPEVKLPPPPPMATKSNKIPTAFEVPEASYTQAPPPVDLPPLPATEPNKQGKKAFASEESSIRPAPAVKTPPPPPPAIPTQDYDDSESIYSRPEVTRPNVSKIQDGYFKREDITKENIETPRKENNKISASSSSSSSPEFNIDKHLLNDLVTKHTEANLPSLVKDLVTEYCELHFKNIAKEIISSELNRLLEEKARLLADT